DILPRLHAERASLHRLEHIDENLPAVENRNRKQVEDGDVDAQQRNEIEQLVNAVLAADTEARVIAIGPPSSRTDCFPEPMSCSTLYTAPAFVHVILRPSDTPASRLIASLREGSWGPAPIRPIVRTAPVTGSVSGTAFGVTVSVSVRAERCTTKAIGRSGDDTIRSTMSLQVRTGVPAALTIESPRSRPARDAGSPGKIESITGGR